MERLNSHSGTFLQKPFLEHDCTEHGRPRLGGGCFTAKIARLHMLTFGLKAYGGCQKTELFVQTNATVMRAVQPLSGLKPK